MNRMKRLAAFLLAAIMVFSVLPVTALATEEGGTSGHVQCTKSAGCTNPDGHEDNCSDFVKCAKSETCTYAENHDGNCSDFVKCTKSETCTYAENHEDNCSDYTAPELCTHGSDKTACETCAAEKAAAESAARVAAVQALIDALPEVTAENKDAVTGQMETIDTEKAKLSDGERAALDITKYNATGEALAALGNESTGEAAETDEDTGSFAQFLTALAKAGYDYDGNGETVTIGSEEFTGFLSHASGAYQNTITHTGDISIRNVNFTADDTDKKGIELVFSNAGALTLTDCNFSGKVGVSTQGGSTAITVDGCSFSGNTGRYSLHHIVSPSVTVTGSSFNNIRGGMYLFGNKTSVTVTGNTFTNIRDDMGAVQFGDGTGNPTVTLTGNKVTGNTEDPIGGFIWQLNSGLALDAAAIKGANTLEGNVFAKGTGTEPAAVATIGSASYYSLAEAFAAVNADTGTDTLTLSISSGTHAPTANEQLKITRANVVIEGAGSDQTTIACGGYSCSGQGGIILGNDSITLRNLTVTATGENIDAVKVTCLDAVAGTMNLCENITISNVSLSSTGHGLNLHGVKNVTVSGVTASGAKCGISLANAVNVAISDTSATGGWASIGMMHKDSSPFYTNPVSLTLGSGNELTSIYTERPDSAEGGAGSIHLTANYTGMVAAGSGLKATTEGDIRMPTPVTGYAWGVMDGKLGKVVKAEVSGSTVTLPENPTAGDLVNAANSASTPSASTPVVITLPASTEATPTNTIPAALVTEVAVKAVDNVQVSVPVKTTANAAKPDASVSFGKAAMTAINSAVATSDPAVTLTVAPADIPDGAAASYDITLKVNGDEVEYFGDTGTVTVTLPLPAGVTDPVVYCLRDDGIKQYLPKGEIMVEGSTISYKTNHFSKWVIGAESTNKAVAQVGNYYYDNLQDAIKDAAVGDTISIVGDISDETVTVNKNLTIQGGNLKPTMNNVKITATSGAALTVDSLKFTGDSYIQNDSKGLSEGDGKNASAITVTNCEATVTPTNNHRSDHAFIGLGTAQGGSLDLTITGNVITMPTGDGYSAVYGWGLVNNVNISGNEITANRAVKIMGQVNGASIVIASNDMNVAKRAVDFYQSAARNNIYTATISGNTVTGTDTFMKIEAQSGTAGSARVNIGSGNTVKGNGVTASNLSISGDVCKNATNGGYVGFNVETDSDGKVINGTLLSCSVTTGENSVLSSNTDITTDGSGNTVVAEKPVIATIGDTKYYSLAEAVEAANGTTDIIKLMDDVSLTETLEIAAGDNITLDLNGYTISYASGEIAGKAVITNKGTLTITGGAIKGTIEAKDDSDTNIYKDAVVEDITLESADARVWAESSAGVESVPDGYQWVQVYGGVALFRTEDIQNDSDDMFVTFTLKISWNDGNYSKRPSSQKVYLMNGEEDVRTLTFTSGNGWEQELTAIRYIFEKPAGRSMATNKAMTIGAENLGDGYTTTVSGDVKEGSTITITNTREVPKTVYVYSETTLLQTGAEAMPIVMLTLGGIFALAAGMWLLRKKSYAR